MLFYQYSVHTASQCSPMMTMTLVCSSLAFFGQQKFSYIDDACNYWLHGVHYTAWDFQPSGQYILTNPQGFDAMHKVTLDQLLLSCTDKRDSLHARGKLANLISIALTHNNLLTSHKSRRLNLDKSDYSIFGTQWQNSANFQIDPVCPILFSNL